MEAILTVILDIKNANGHPGQMLLRIIKKYKTKMIVTKHCEVPYPSRWTKQGSYGTSDRQQRCYRCYSYARNYGF